MTAAGREMHVARSDDLGVVVDLDLGSFQARVRGRRRR